MKAFDQFPGETTEPLVLQKLATGQGLLWVVCTDVAIGGAITQLYEYQGFCALQIVALGGIQLESWREEFDRVMDKYGRFHGCKRVEFYGRKGWERRLPNYTVNRIMMVREL